MPANDLQTKRRRWFSNMQDNDCQTIGELDSTKSDIVIFHNARQ
jgi:hypothetical protein